VWCGAEVQQVIKGVQPHRLIAKKNIFGDSAFRAKAGYQPK
jgi:hypothetical protein